MIKQILDKLTNRSASAPSMFLSNTQIKRGGFSEDPKVTAAREEAKRKLAEWGRQSLSEGGGFSLNNDVLLKNRNNQMSLMPSRLIQ